MAAESPAGGLYLSLPFTGGTGRKLGLVFLVFLCLNLVVEGFASFLASSIRSIARQIPHSAVAEDIHATILYGVREAHQAVIQGNARPQSDLNAISVRAGIMIAAYLEDHLTKEESFPEDRRLVDLGVGYMRMILVDYATFLAIGRARVFAGFSRSHGPSACPFVASH